MDESSDNTPNVPPAPAPPAGWNSASELADARKNPWSNEADDSDSERASENPGMPTSELPPPPDQTSTFPASAAFGPPAPNANAEVGKPPKQRRRGASLLAGLVIGAIVGGGAGAAVFTWMDDDTPQPATNQGGSGDQPGGEDEPAGDADNGSVDSAASLSSVAAVAEQVQPSVVSIAVNNQFGEGTGSGVILSPDGDILTNSHVVQGANSVTVTFSDGSTAEADVVETDPRMDLAVVKARDVSGLHAAGLGSSDALTVGEQLVAIGSPLGLDGTVTTGIVSAMERPVTATGEVGQTTSFIDAIQTDAPINPGNSGGPLVNMAGEVIGINSAIATDGRSSGSIGLGFAIPVDSAKEVIDQLRNGENPTHARLGVFLDTTAGELGALVDEVESGSAAEAAELRAGDIIKKIDDRIVVDSAELIAATLSHRPGDTVTLTYERNGEEHTVEVTLGSDAESA